METKQLQKMQKMKSCGSFQDRISQLPDETLILILCLLTLQEAGRTSVLSSRWTNLWKFVPSLDFGGAPKCWSSIPRNPYGIALHRDYYLSYVNNVLRLHMLPYVDIFAVCCDLDATKSPVIDEWMKRIIPKKVKILVLDLTSHMGCERYTLSQEFKFESNLFHIKFLTSLTLKNINVNGEYIEYFLSKCSLLVTLRVIESMDLVNLKVTGSSLMLNYLYIGYCRSLDSVELCAPRLATFIFRGRGTRFIIGKNPLLTNLIIGGYYNRVDHRASLVPFARHFPQLHDLKLDFCFSGMDKILHVCNFSNLKSFKLQVNGYHGGSILDLTNIILAAPSLHEFILMLEVPKPETISGVTVPVLSPPYPGHHCLKIVKIYGFVGGFVDSEIATYLAVHAKHLEDMLLVLSHRCRDNHHGIILKEYYPPLKRMLPSSCKLEIGNHTVM